jgi:anaerobic magnesium-protoporphyrin IX monomethyl ester cyclase
MNVLLIEPPFFRLLGEKRRWTPVGLLNIANKLIEAGYNVTVYNADADYSSEFEIVLSYSDRFYLTDRILDNSVLSVGVFEEIFKVIEEYEPDIIGISVKSDSVPIVQKLIMLIKRLAKPIKVVLGGPHFDIDPYPEYFREADMIFKGEAEGSIVAALNELMFTDEKPLIISSTDLRDTILPDNLRPLNLNSLPDFQFNHLYLQKKQLISACRGCPFKCSFCYKSIDSGRVRFLSGENLVKNMQALDELHKINRFYIVDDTFGVNETQLIEMKKTLQDIKAQYSWSCMSHVRVLNRRKVALMKQMGCNAVHLGIESGSEKMLKLLKKQITVDQIKECAALLNEYEIELRAFMMVGLPGETDLDVNESLSLLEEIKPNEVAAQVYQPYPNTILYKKLEQKGVKITIDWTTFKRYDLNYSLFQGQAPEKIDRRIRRFLTFADSWNSGYN